MFLGLRRLTTSLSFSTGQKIIARIETNAPICLERFADYPQLGRFTLRDEGKTVAIGKVRNSIYADSRSSRFSTLGVLLRSRSY